MKKQLIISLALVLGLTSIAQPSFAMKRSRPEPWNSISVDMVNSFIAVVGWHWANYVDRLEQNVLPYQSPAEQTLGAPTTFQSRSGTNFAVPANELHAFLELTPTIANMFSDFEDSGMTIPLSIGDQVLYLLTQMASGANEASLLYFIRSLSPRDIDNLKEEATFLDSRELKILICRALHNLIGFISQSGHYFAVPAADLPALMELSPSLATLLWDLAGTDMSAGISLNIVHDPALSLLTIMASEDYPAGLLQDYIRSLNLSQIEELKKDAELLDSQALKDLISRALYNPFETLTNDVASLIFAQIGPQARTNCREVNRAFKRAVDLVRLPSGSGCTDKLPIVTTIQVYAQAWMPVLHGQMLYVVNYSEGIVYVFDTKNAHRLVSTIFVGQNPLPIVIYGKMLYVANHADSTVSVIDTFTNKVVATIKVGTHPLPPFVRDEMLYVENLGDGTFSQIDPNSYKVAATYPCFRPIPRPLDGRQMLYSVNVVDGTIKVFAPDLFTQLAIVHVFNGPRGSVVHGQIGYVANAELGTVSVIDQNTFQVLGIIEVGGEPHQLVVHGQLLYVMDRNNGTVTVIDLGGYLPGQH